MDVIKNICLYLILGFVLNGFCYYIESDYLKIFLHNQIITLSITLVAITSAVRGIVLGKLTDLSITNKELDFRATFKEIKISIYEQIFMVLISTLLLIVYNSKKIVCHNLLFIIDSLLVSVFLYSIYILFDTAKAVVDIFIKIEEKNRTDNEN